MNERPTRSQVLGTLILDTVLHARLTWREYAADVVEHYHATVARDERVVDFQIASTAEQFEAVAKNNAQTVRRYVTGERILVADLEESLVAALPEPHRERVQSAVLARSGLMHARSPSPAGDGAGHVRSAADLMRRTADAMDVIAPMFDDQAITAADAPHFGPARKALRCVMAACLTLEAQMAAAVAPTGVAPRQSRDVH